MRESKAIKKTIHLFLASSIVDMKDDRDAIGNFINDLNKIYNSQNLFIHLHKCEDESEDHSIINGGTQKSLNDEIRESDLCLVLFWHKAGDITEEELEVALDEFKLNNNPKIVVYFKNLADGESLTDDVKRVMAKIDQELLHYHREYSHIDSLKLGIITQLQVHGFLRIDMKVEDEHLMVSGHKIISTKNIPVYSQNEEYLKLVEECHKAEDVYNKLYRQYSENRDNARLYRAYQKAIKDRQRLHDDLAEIANQILNIGTEITKTISTSDPSERIMDAIRCFDRGDFDGVLDILHPDEIDDYFMQANVLEEKAEEKANLIRQSGIEKANMVRQNGIDEYRCRILALEAQGKWSQVYENYERVITQVESEGNAPKTIMLEFARFLHRQKNYKKSIDVCMRLQSALAQNPRAISEYETAELYDLLGELYYHTLQYEAAEVSLKKAIGLEESNTFQGQERDMLVAASCVKLAKVYFKVTRFNEAETLYLQALERYKIYDTDEIEPVDVDIASTSLELGNLYYMVNRHEDARKLFLEAYRKYKDLVLNGEQRFRSEMAKAANKVAYLDVAVYSHRKAERYYVHALKIKQMLTQKEPVSYFLFLERICRKLALFWNENGDTSFGNMIMQQAERIKTGIIKGIYVGGKEDYRALDYAYYEQAINKTFIESLLQESLHHYSILADENPEAYEPSLAHVYNVAGVFYSQIGDKQKAEVNYAEAISIRERLVKREQAMKPSLAASYSNLSQHYAKWEKYDKAEKYALLAVDIYKGVSKEKDGAFNTDLARNYNALANLYVKSGKNKLAEECYKDSLMLYIKLYEKSSRAYIDRIINTVNNIVTFFDPIESAKWMEEFVVEEKVEDWLSDELCIG